MDEEMGVTGLMVMRAVGQPNVPPVAYTRLVEALCRQLRRRRHLSSEGRDDTVRTIAAWLDGRPPS
ncbi:MAG TPA: hypothetical protein VII06_23655 [Chloroflexota bacterium]